MNRRREHAGYQEGLLRPLSLGRAANAVVAAAFSLGLAIALAPINANAAVTLRGQCAAAASTQSSQPSGTAPANSSDILVYTPGGSSGTAASPATADQASAGAQSQPCTTTPQ